MLHRLHLPALVVALMGATTLAACDSPADVHDHPLLEAALQKTGTGQLSDLAAEVRQVTARFHSQSQATKAGYVIGSPCVVSPAGGMGFHWLNVASVDPVFDPLHPEVVLYEPGPGKSQTLVAIEYVVVDVGQPAPTFEGHPFDIGGAPLPFPHWTLHVWLHKDNPNGIFTQFNPAVTCP